MTNLTPPTHPESPLAPLEQASPWWARGIAALPLLWVQRIGTALGWIAYCASPSYRRKFSTQWQQAALVCAGDNSLFSPAARRHAIGQSGILITETLWIWLRPHSEVVAKVICEDTKIMDDAQLVGKGIIFLTPHLGAFEVTARYYASRAPITVLFKPSKITVVNRLLAEARELPQLHTAPADSSGVRKLLRALKNGQAVGLLPDQVPGDGQGQWASFFGKAAYTMTLPQKLSALTGAPLVLAVGQRLPKGQGWKLHFATLLGEASPQAVNNAMEGLVRKLPSQYLWGYNRFKQPTKKAVE